jgi:hypothetical protein
LDHQKLRKIVIAYGTIFSHPDTAFDRKATSATTARSRIELDVEGAVAFANCRRTPATAAIIFPTPFLCNLLRKRHEQDPPRTGTVDNQAATRCAKVFVLPEPASAMTLTLVWATGRSGIGHGSV